MDILYQKLREREFMVVALKCPFYGSEDARSYGTSNDKKWYTYNNPSCFHKTFCTKYSYNGYKPNCKEGHNQTGD
jgi:hypothetical protein